jgi:hypothetical protein
MEGCTSLAARDTRAWFDAHHVHGLIGDLPERYNRDRPSQAREPTLIRELPAVHPIAPTGGAPGRNDEHPMRLFTQKLVAEPKAWTLEEVARIRRFFDDLAPDWNRRFADDTTRDLPLADALERGGVPQSGACIELGSGTGLSTPLLARRYAKLVACDLSAAMLRQAPAGAGWRVRADAACLPVPDGWADVVVAVNMFLFAEEVARVLARNGALVWVSSIGPDTPIYLPTEVLTRALPGAWGAVWSRAGAGRWAVVRRVDARRDPDAS